ncbi:MAG: cobalamin-dependent protein [Eubacteriales bacterium]
MNFLIVSPKFNRRFGEYYEFPLGLAYISSSLKSAGYNVNCLNLNHYDEPLEEILAKVICERNIDVLCTGGLAPHYNRIKTIIETAKNIKPSIITILGGGIFSSEPALMLNALKIDFGVIGEGEQTIVELANAITNSQCYESVRGIAYRSSNGEIVITPKRPPIMDLASIPYPDLDGFEVEKYLDLQMTGDNVYTYPLDKPRRLPMIASRSCPYNCTFCYHPLGNVYRQRTLDDFFKELDYLVNKYNINMLFILDELFSHNKERVIEFCLRIKKYNLKWITQMRVDGVDQELLDMFKDAGCYCLLFGLESINDTVLKSMKKHTNKALIEKALKLTKNARIGIQGHLIFGDVAETQETAEETLNWWVANKEYGINLSLVDAYPGTEIYSKALEKGLILDKISFLENACLGVNISKMSDGQLKELSEKIGRYVDEYAVYGNLIDYEKIKDDQYKGEIYRFRVECPHCKYINEYANYNTNGVEVIFKLGCRECNQKFCLDKNLFDHHLRSKLDQIFAKVPPHRLAIFGASDFTRRQLMPAIVARGVMVACIFDNHKMKHGMNVHGVEVVPFSGNHAEIKKVIDGIIIAVPNFEKDIYNQISFLAQYGIEIFKLSQVGCD